VIAFTSIRRNLHSINVEGLKTLIRSDATPPFPLAAPRMQILAIVMGGKGNAELTCRVVRDSPWRIITVSAHPHRIRIAGEPHDINGVKMHVQNCKFPQAGLYWVELLNFGDVVARQPFRLVS
jgi:hypothetical protein